MTGEHSIIKIQIRNEQDIVAARQRARKIAELMHFENQDKIRIATVASELTRNMYQYAGGGMIEFALAEVATAQSLVLYFRDKGPGIATLSAILDGSYVSATGMGVGLIGSKRLMDDFRIESSAQTGTSIRISKQRNRRLPPITAAQIGLIADEPIKVRPLTALEEVQKQNHELMLALETVTTQKSELSELNQELTETNRGVVALYAELDEKADSLQKANAVKTSFLSNMTHEFRTPLGSIISLSRILLDGIDGELNEEQQKQVNYMRKSAEGLMELVNDLLDLAKVEAGKITVKPTEFAASDVLGGLRGVFRPLLGANPEVDLQVSWADDLQLLTTDEGKLSQILRNLVSNAIKYTERGLVTVHAENGKDQQILFSVLDTGIGIAKEHLEHIFLDFAQVESTLQDKVKGTGLGLPLSRKLAHLLGGEVWAESQLGKGSVFYLSIPRVYVGGAEGVIIQDSAAVAAQNGTPN